MEFVCFKNDPTNVVEEGGFGLSKVNTLQMLSTFISKRLVVTYIGYLRQHER